MRISFPGRHIFIQFIPGDEPDAILLFDVLVGALDQEDLVLLQVVVDTLQPLDDLGGPAILLVVLEAIA